MRRIPLALLLPVVAAAVLATGCEALESVGIGPNRPDPQTVRAPDDVRVEPAHVVVRQVLVSFAETGRRGVTRTKAQAEALARAVLARAQAGADFAELVRTCSDDLHAGGVLAIANWGVPPRADEVERERIVRGVSRAAFGLAPGAIALVEHHPSDSPSGWVILRRDD